jgi:hypothetical protein
METGFNGSTLQLFNEFHASAVFGRYSLFQ